MFGQENSFSSLARARFFTGCEVHVATETGPPKVKLAVPLRSAARLPGRLDVD
jgi:hypothetical protein